VRSALSRKRPVSYAWAIDILLLVLACVIDTADAALNLHTVTRWDDADPPGRRLRASDPRPGRSVEAVAPGERFA
jgi:hypothetical protein